jgi:MFS family permease
MLKTNASGKPKAVPLREALNYIGNHWRTVLTHNLGFAALAFSAYGSTAWLPEVFLRVHEWEAGKFGLIYGTIFFLAGASGILFGGILSDWLSAKGYRDAKVRVGFIAAIIWIPSGIVFPLLDSDFLAIVLVVPSVFFTAMPFGVAPAAIQEMMPNNLRGQTSAIYIFVVNIIGLAVGPLTLALMTDFLFTEAAFGIEGIRYSLLTTTGVAHVLAGILLWRCMGHFRDSLDWKERHVGR